jgi:PAS domain S-box-containing protein
MLSEDFLMDKEKFCNELENRSTNDKLGILTIKVIFLRLLAMLIALSFIFYPIKSVFALELSADEQAYLHIKETIVFVSQTRYPPFEFFDRNNEHTGMCIELARWMAAEFGFKAKFTDTYFKQAQQDILFGKADVLTSFFYSKKRDESFDFTHVMFEVPASIFVAAERTDIKDIHDLNGKRIAMQAGDYAKEFLESKPIRFDVAYTKDFAEATDLVISGKADAIIGDEQIVLYHIFKDNLTEKIKKVGDPLYIGPNCMAAKEGNRVLISILNKGIKLAQQSGVLEKINRKWIGTHYTPRESLLFKYLTQIYISAGAILVLALLIWFWNVRLRQVVKERTEKLKKSEEKYRELAEFLPQPVFELDIRGNFIYSNRCGLETFGYTIDDFEKGVNALQLFIPEDRERVQKNIQKRLAGEDFEDHEYTGLKKDGSVFPILIYSAPIMRDGKTAGVRGIVLDITERKRTEEQIIQAKQEWEKTFNTVPDLIAIIDDKHRMVRVNKAMADRFGVSPDEVTGLTCYECVHGTKEPPSFCPHTMLLSDGQEHVKEVYEDRLDGIFQVSVTPFQDRDGNLVGSVHVARDITERKRVEKALLDSEEKYKLLAEHSADVIYKLNIENEQYMYVSPSVERILGYTAKESLSLRVQDVLTTESYIRQRENLIKAIASGKRDPEIMELEAVHKDGYTVPVEIHANFILDERGNPLEILGVARDITERKRIEKQIKTSLKEKEILLREIHHRVKNNLAVISSLLSMQANIIQEGDVHKALQESQSRIRAMALIHETLYQSESLALVDLEKYVKELIGNVVNTFEGISGRIDFEIQVRDVKLEVNQAVPCGLIINELATNAIKHAFSDKQNGMVRIFARYSEDNEIELKVSDNGVGFTEELDWKKSKSLGMRLITLLVDQLHGTLNIKNHDGAEIVVKWPVIVT